MGWWSCGWRAAIARSALWTRCALCLAHRSMVLSRCSAWWIWVRHRGFAMRQKIQTVKILDGAVATGAGSAHEVDGPRLGIYIQVATTATVKIETSPDGSLWMDTSITAKTATAYFALDELHRYVRANVTAWTSGAVNVWVAQVV